MPIITRNPLAYTRTASGFSQAMVSAQQNVSSQPNNNFRPKAGSLLPESNAAPWSVNVQSGQTLSGIVRDQMAARGFHPSQTTTSGPRRVLCFLNQTRRLGASMSNQDKP